jgi:hypothetical protein
MGNGMKQHHIREIAEDDPDLMEWLKQARQADKHSRVEREEVSPCGTSSALLSEFAEIGTVAVSRPLKRHMGAE